MRTAGFLLSVLLLASGCKGKGDADAAPNPAALKAQQDLVSRRDALMAERKKLETSIQSIETQIADKKAKGEDVTELEKQRTELASKRDNQVSEVSTLDSKLDQLTTAQGGLAAREAALAQLERKLQSDIAEVARQQEILIKAQAAANDAASKWKDTCNVGSTQIVQVAAPKGSNYTRAEVEQVYAKAKNLMRTKGLLPGDLGAGASLESDTQAAMSKQDWVGAYVSASQLAKAADRTKIDRNFIAAKHKRLQERVMSGKRDEALQKQLSDGLTDILNKYNDGNLNAANAKLNQLWALVR